MSAPNLQVRSILLPAEDLETLVGFYRDTVGLDLLMRDGDRYAELDGGAVKIAVASPSDHPVGTAPVLAFKTADVAGTFAALMAGGATALMEPRSGAHETRAVLRDPAGNAFVIYGNRT